MMKKTISNLTILLFAFTLLFQAIPANAQNEGLPSYVKWGRIAMTKTQEKYPDSEITDYLHVGKENKNGKSVEKFKLIVKNQNKEIGVFVNLTFDTRTERLLAVNMTEGRP
ncbi:DUF3889 domain-containing protein [Niallia sp. NCCP-28]|uniref:DUF3889 domain-containing protein n=1 Tax=Niallia sp. NCCP-28 TaxID=2934712 RepID=UPI002082AB80|nr:DUF3889 domain-containing protein [Niallia sp. NCCP-28]GKU84771.1 hypothetical protein NCCP28_41670 [Niallia sp. NCCP-28]